MLRRELFGGILAGLCISLGGSAFLSCDNKYVGAVLFSVALLSICMFGFSLYTGKIGYVVENHGIKDIARLAVGFLGNAIGCAMFGLLFRLGLESASKKAEVLCAAKLAESIPEALVRAFFCGVLMYIAVWMYKSKSTSLGIFICVPVFILSGFEHSIANMFYFSAACSFNINSIIYILLIVLGNTVGGVTIPLLQKFTEEGSSNG